MKACKEKGAKLFEPKSSITFKGVSGLAHTLGLNGFWLGIHDKFSEGTYMYESDHSTLAWTNWIFGEPNNAYDNEDCAEVLVNQFDGKWMDSLCSHHKSFICEKDSNTDWEHHEWILNRWYIFSDMKKSKEDAEKFCKQKYAKLVEPKKKSEYDEIVAVAKYKGLKEFWLGVNDKSNEGTFVYGSDQSSVNWTNWYPGEPNNSYNNEDCVISAGWASWKWVDTWCAKLLPVVCQNDW